MCVCVCVEGGGGLSVLDSYTCLVRHTRRREHHVGGAVVGLHEMGQRVAVDVGQRRGGRHQRLAQAAAVRHRVHRLHHQVGRVGRLGDRDENRQTETPRATLILTTKDPRGLKKKILSSLHSFVCCFLYVSHQKTTNVQNCVFFVRRAKYAYHRRRSACYIVGRTGRMNKKQT